MCGRYTLHQKGSDLAKRFNIARIEVKIPNSYNIAPTQYMPVITLDENGKRQVELMKWGISKTIQGRKRDIFNTRNDKAFTWFWKDAVSHRRCLVPADGYFEWTKVQKGSDEPKRKYFFRPRDESLFAFAGIWESWKDVEGLEWKSYSIITTEPNKEAARVHDRMPVILHQEDEASWLEPSQTDRGALEALLRPYEDNGLEVFEVDSDVNAYRFNNEKLIYPLNSQ